MAIYNEDIYDQLGTDGTNFSTHICSDELLEQLGMNGTLNELMPLITVIDTVGLNDILTKYMYALAVDQLGMEEVLTPIAQRLLNALDTVGVDDTPTNNVVLSLVASDLFDADDTASSNAILIDILSSTIGVGLQINFAGETYTGWVLNTENAGSTRYEGYNFNSMTMFKGQYLGTMDDGIYQLTGDTDAGTEIDAYFRTGAMTFGTERQKRVPTLYLGIRADGELLFKTVTDEKIERVYELTSYDDNLSDKRVRLHRKVRSRYWQFSLHNKAGSDFELDQIDFLPIILTRRTGGKK